MQLRTVLAGFPEKLISTLNSSLLEQEVSAVTSDSRQVKPGSIYVAVRGASADGHQFIRDAVASGARLILGETPQEPLGAPYLQIASSRQSLAKLAANFYGNPSKSMKVVGVTGTSGKTTMTYLIESVLRANGFNVGVIGTINFRFAGKVVPATHTTPGAVELQALLAEMRDAGCNAVVMEVSSHALKQNRAAFIAYDAAVFTNLSPEHMDFHPDMEDYFQSKAILFRGAMAYSVNSGKSPVLAINADDRYGERLVKELQPRLDPRLKLLGFGLGEGDLNVDLDGVHGEINGVRVDSSLTGRFNAYNLLAAIAVAQGMGLDRAKTAQGIRELKCVPGRMERVENGRGLRVFVDYAHKSDALENVLSTLHDIQGESRLITVFGCGGDRDRNKRPVMGSLAIRFSDHVFVTSDNPRTEDPRSIIEEILGGVREYVSEFPDKKDAFTVEPDRRRAIFAAIASAKPGDIVLIAGKGHEDYQIVGKQKIHFDDREVAREALSANSK